MTHEKMVERKRIEHKGRHKRMTWRKGEIQMRETEKLRDTDKGEIQRSETEKGRDTEE